MGFLTGRLVRLLANEQGTFTVWATLSTLVLMGGVGLGLDTYRLQNARTALDQVVALTCDRVSNADFALYPTTASLVTMGGKFSADQILKTSLDPAVTTVALSVSGANIAINASSSVAATVGQVLGQTSLPAVSTATCAPLSRTPPTACSSSTLLYHNPGAFQLTPSTIVSGQSTYAANLVNASGYVTTRLLVGGSYGNTNALLNSTSSSDIVALQPFHTDGSIPGPCNPTLNPPPSGAGVCTEAIAIELAVALGKSSTDDHYPNPNVVAAESGSNLNLVSSTNITIPIPITPDFDPTTKLSSAPTAAADYMQRVADTILGVAGAHNLPAAVQDLTSGGQLYRIMTGTDSVWVVNNACVYAISPIVLDLTDAGFISTTGSSTARSLLPRPVGKTVAFDMLGSGRKIATEWLVGNGQGLLVDNRDGNAERDMTGRRLFGSVGGYANGYEKLAQFDEDGDGKLTGAELDGLAVWIDDGDGIVQPGELKTLAELGVTELSVKVNPTAAPRGGTYLRSTGVRNGRPMMTEDVWFNMYLGALAEASGARKTLR